MKLALKRILRSRLFLIGAGLLVTYAACGFWLLPYLVERYVPQYARDTLKRQASIGKVRINPFLLSFEANDFRLAERDGSPIVGVRRLYVDFETSSLLRWAWVFADIAVDGLDLHVVTLADGRVNLLELAAAMAPDTPSPPGKNDEAPPRMVLQHVALSNGRTTYTDRSGPAPASATLAPIDLQFDDVSTLPERKGPYTIFARLPGSGTVRWRGEVSLRPVASDGELTVAKFRPASIWKFMQDKLRLAPPEGEVDFTTRYSFKLAGGKPQLLLRGAKLSIAGLSVRQPGAAQPLLALQTIDASDVGFDLQRRQLSVPKLEIGKGRVAASVARNGALDWQTIAIAGSSGTTPALPPRAAKVEPWRIGFDALEVADVGIRFTDASRAAPLSLEVGNVAIRAKAQLEVGGAASAMSSNALHIELSKIALARLNGGAPLVSLESVTLESKAIDTAARQVDLREIAVRGGGTALTRDAQGGIDLLQALNPADRGKLRTAAEQTGAAARAEGAPWRVRLDALKLGEFRVALADRSFEPALRYDLVDVSATLKNLSNDLSAPVDFDAALRVGQGGAFSASGSFIPDGSRADARVKLTRLNLVPLQPAVARFATLALKSGNISANCKLRYRATKSRPSLRATGRFDVAGLLIDESGGGRRFLAWKSLAVDGIRFGLAPDRLTVADVRVVEPDAKLTVFKDRSVNVAKVVKKRAASPGSRTAPGGGFPVTVERVRVQGGTVDFADLSLVLPFAAHVTALDGSATGLSSDPSSRAQLKLEGRVEPDGLARVNGAINPFAPKRFTDLRTEFRNVAMTPLSPYSVTFAGRRIASGKLSLDLEYKINDGKLLGDNKVLLDKFTLGERVESPSALHLPLDLAIALLTDADGKIDVAVPVRGDLEHPDFSYGHLIWQAIVTVIKNVVTAPFRALGALLGGGAGQLDAIAFDPGSDRVLPPELEKMRKVAEALNKRPQLKVIVDGRYDGAADGAALRDEKVRRELAAALGAKLEPGEEPGPVAVDSAKTQLALEKLMTARSGERAMAEFTAQFEKRSGREAKRVNAALAFFGKGSSDHAFYEALYKRLVALHPLDAAELEALAQRRAAAVEKSLVETAQIDAARVALGKTGSAKATERGTVDTRLSLDVLRPSQ
jgi:uncharacterized protein involved in outer membrane biogenesis